MSALRWYLGMIDQIKKNQIAIERLLESVAVCLTDFASRLPGSEGGLTIQVMSKEDNTLVSEADYAANSLLKDGLARIFPGVPVRSEEDEKGTLLEWEQGGYWLIDPLDGTSRFLKGHDDFAVLVAFISERGLTEAGWMVFPAKNQTFWSIGSSFGESSTQDGMSLGLSSSLMLDRARVYYRWDRASQKSSSATSVDRRSVAEEFGVLDHKEIHSGEAFRQLLTGAMDGVILKLGRLEEWDIAAPAAIVRALGGSVVDIHGDEFRFGAGESSRVVIMSPKHFQEELIELARAFARDYGE